MEIPVIDVPSLATIGVLHEEDEPLISDKADPFTDMVTISPQSPEPSLESMDDTEGSNHGIQGLKRGRKRKNPSPEKLYTPRTEKKEEVFMVEELPEDAVVVMPEAAVDDTLDVQAPTELLGSSADSKQLNGLASSYTTNAAAAVPVHTNGVPDTPLLGTPIKRKRGRPKKNAVAPPGTYYVTPQNTPTPGTGKKRGRPRKYPEGMKPKRRTKAQLTNVAPSPDAPILKITNVRSEADTNTTPVEAKTVSAHDSNNLFQQRIKRPRGRPKTPKAIQEVTFKRPGPGRPRIKPPKIKRPRGRPRSKPRVEDLQMSNRQYEEKIKELGDLLEKRNKEIRILKDRLRELGEPVEADTVESDEDEDSGDKSESRFVYMNSDGTYTSATPDTPAVPVPVLQGPTVNNIAMQQRYASNMVDTTQGSHNVAGVTPIPGSLRPAPSSFPVDVAMMSGSHTAHPVAMVVNGVGMPSLVLQM